MPPLPRASRALARPGGPSCASAREVRLMQAKPARFLEWPKASSGSESAVASWLSDLARRPENRGALRHWEVLPARPARHGELSYPLPEPLREALEHRGISRLYSHQVQAIEALRGGLDTVVVTGTASGRSEEHTSELQSPCNLVCRLLLEKKKNTRHPEPTPRTSQPRRTGHRSRTIRGRALTLAGSVPRARPSCPPKEPQHMVRHTHTHN